MITDFTKLNRDQVVSILEASGYGASDIDEVNYVSCVAGQLRYEIEFEDEHTGESHKGNVYISFDTKGQLTAEF